MGRKRTGSSIFAKNELLEVIPGGDLTGNARKKISDQEKIKVLAKDFDPPGYVLGRHGRLSDLQRKQLAAMSDGLTPLEFAASVLRDENSPFQHRQWAAELLMPYMHMKLPAKERLQPLEENAIDPELLKGMDPDKVKELSHTLEALGISVL
jgi:hypothetical protein